MPETLAVVGGGWAGIAAAVEATRQGHAVTLYEMAPQLGGRSRAADDSANALDNGQHILIGAYVETLALMRTLGVDPAKALLRMPLSLTYPDASGLRLRPGPPLPAFVAAVLRTTAWPWAARIALLRAATAWALAGFRCAASLSVAELTSNLPAPIRSDLIDPLCVAALNTPATEASAQVFLRVLKDALFAAPGSSDLLLPCLSLSALVPDPATRWLEAEGASLRLRHRVGSLAQDGEEWRVDGDKYSGVILACTPREAARLARGVAPEWSQAAQALRYEPIVTVYLHGRGVHLPSPMMALRESADAPAQFVLDRGQLGGPAGLLAFVVSGAQAWVDRGTTAVLEATLAQARTALGLTLNPVRTLVEKRATFRCTPALIRPPMVIAPGLTSAGDHVEGPYPATLEGAVRSGLAAARAWA